MKESVTAIVLAAGQGKRMNSNIQKQFMILDNYPVLYYSLKCFQECSKVTRIILVTGQSEIEYCKNHIVDPYNFLKVTDIIAGGAERYDSVEQGLKCIQDGIVIIHDGARPFVTNHMILESIDVAIKEGACTVGMPVKDTIKVVNEFGYGIQTPDRKTLWQIQTPQAFQVPIIKEAYRQMRMAKDENITDDTMLVERYLGIRTKVIEGDYKNMKITTPEDMALAETFIRN